MRLFGWFQKGECPRTRALASEYLDGRLDPPGRTRVEEHLATCPGCRAELESLRATVALLRGLPEAVPQKHFAVAPARPLPGRWSLPVLRYATAAVVVLLVGAVAVDQAGVLERDAGPGRFGPEQGTYGLYAEYWAVGGVRNTIGSEEKTQVVLVVPDGTDNASAAVELLSTNGMVWGSMQDSAADVTRLVLQESGEGAVASGGVEEFAVVSAPSGSAMTLAINDSELPSTLGAVVQGQDGSHLNMVSSDYSALYSFDMASSEKVAVTAPETGGDRWLRPVEYGLIALAALLGAATAGVWLRRRSERLAEARVDGQ